MVARCVPVPVTVQVQAATSSDPEVAARDFATAGPGYLVPLYDPPTPEPLVLLRRNEAASVAPDPGYACLYDLSVEVSVTARGHAWRYSYPASARRASEAARGSVQVSSGSGMAFSAGDLVLRVYWGADSDRVQVEFPEWDGRMHYGAVYGSPGLSDLVAGLDGAPRRFSVSGPVEFYPTPGSAVAETVGTVAVSGVAAAGRLSDAGSAWDVLYSPRTGLRRVVYAGDLPSFSAPESGDSLRGEALAYLMSGYGRVAGSVGSSVGGPGLPWIGGDGKVSSVPLFWGLGGALSDSPSLDLFRLRLLGFVYARRAAVPPLSGPSGGWAPSVFLEEGHSTSGGAVSQASPDFPGWGTAYSVCASRAALDANGGDWLADGGTYADPYDASPAGWASFMLFAALNSPAQPVPCPLEPSPAPSPDPGGRFAEGYVPPSGGGPAEDPPQRLRARDVAALFARPSGDPAAFTRAWARMLCGGALRDGAASFRFDARAEGDETVWSSDALASAAGGAWLDLYDPAVSGYSYVLCDKTGQTPVRTVLAGAGRYAPFLYGAWPDGDAGRRSGPVAYGVRQASARVTTTSDSQGEGVAAGSSWIVAAYSDASSPYPPFVDWFPNVVNYRSAQSQSGYEPTGVPETGLFDVPYASVPPSASDVPVEAPDDVACLPLCTAVVEWTRDDLDDGASAPVPGGGASGRTHAVHGRWRVCMPVPASFSPQGGAGPSFGRWTREAGSSSWTFSGTGANAVPPDADPSAPSASFVALAKAAVDAVKSAYPQDAAAQSLPDPSADPALMLAGSSSFSFVPRQRVYYEVWGDDGSEPLASWQAYDRVLSGDAVSSASLSVEMELRHGIFESGYCA